MRKNTHIENETLDRSATAAAPLPPSHPTAAPGPERALRAPRSLRSRLVGQLASFGFIGGIAFVVDLAVYNVLRASVLQESPIWSKVASVAVATIVAWLGNRYLTFRRERSPHAVREGVLFAIVNVVGLLIAAACLFVSHYMLGFTSQLADNISGNGIGLVLGTAFRFAAYRWLVFSPRARTLRLPRSARRPALDIGGNS